MTDVDGHHHHFTMPVGKIQPHLWTKQKQYASDILPTVFSELVNATKHPFVQSITDVLSYKVSFLNDKVLLVGDAVAGFRPHTAASTRQAAYDALLLDQRMKGQISHDEMVEEMLDFAERISASGVWMGTRSQFESLKGQGEDDKWHRKIATCFSYFF
jgi:2-polyprenyl-6-methoxyphenol hydroxylase-like FAD-dependent oxidoreductase